MVLKRLLSVGSLCNVFVLNMYALGDSFLSYGNGFWNFPPLAHDVSTHSYHVGNGAGSCWSSLNMYFNIVKLVNENYKRDDTVNLSFNGVMASQNCGKGHVFLTVCQWFIQHRDTLVFCTEDKCQKVPIINTKHLFQSRRQIRRYEDRCYIELHK